LDFRPTRAVVKRAAVEHNWRLIKGLVPETTRVMAVVKANAYGHGAVELSRMFESLGCDYLGVAIAEEGMALREGGINSPIVVLGGVSEGALVDLFGFDLTPVVFDMKTASLINGFASASGVKKKIHVKIDSGMGRLGLMPGEVLSFFAALSELKNIEVEGTMSHLAESESVDTAYSDAQIKLFLDLVGGLKRSGVDPGLLGMANSAAIVNLPASRMDIVRPGLMLYGSYPSSAICSALDLEPALELQTRVLQVKKIPKGSSVSYGRTFTAERDSTIAVLPIGYGDGLPRRLSGAGSVLVRGCRAPIAGVVCMDLTMCDVTGIDGVEAGDPVVVIGSMGSETIAVEDVAREAGTISYEILCNISARVPRVYA
jgi:alanine racemase